MMLQLAQCHPTRCFTSQTCNVQTQRARLQTWMCSGNRPEGGSGAKVASDAQRRALLFGLTAGLVAGNAKAEQTSDNTPRVGEVPYLNNNDMHFPGLYCRTLEINRWSACSDAEASGMSRAEGLNQRPTHTTRSDASCVTSSARL